MHVFYATGHFTSHSYTSVSVIHDIVSDDDVFARNPTIATVFVFSGLDANGVVSHVKSRIFNQYIFAGFHVKTVPVLGEPRISNGYIANNQVFNHQRMNVPGRRILKNGSVKQDSFTVLDAYQYGTKKIVNGFEIFLGFQIQTHILVGTFRSLHECFRWIPTGFCSIDHSSGSHKLFPLVFGYF